MLPNDDTTIYGAVSWGFKSGGFAAAPQGIEFTEPLDQEEAVNYELGVKIDLGGHFPTERGAVLYGVPGPANADLRPADRRGGLRDLPDLQRRRRQGPGNRGGSHLGGERATGRCPASTPSRDSEFGDTNIPGTAFPDQSGQDLIRAPENKFNINADYGVALANGSELGAEPELALHRRPARRTGALGASAGFRFPSTPA